MSVGRRGREGGLQAQQPAVPEHAAMTSDTEQTGRNRLNEGVQITGLYLTLTKLRLGVWYNNWTLTNPPEDANTHLDLRTTELGDTVLIQ